MRSYGVVTTNFWTDQRTQVLSDEAKLLHLYLLSGPHTTLAGCFRLPLPYVAADLGWPLETVSERFMELSKAGLAYHCSNTGWVVIPAFFESNAPANSNVGISIAKQVEHVPAAFSHFPKLFSMLEQVANRLPDGFLNGFRNRYGNDMPNQEQKQEQIQDQGQDQQPDQDPDAGEGVLLTAVTVETESGKTPAGDYSPDFLEFWASYPLKKSKGAAWKAWKALGQKRPPLAELRQAIKDAMKSPEWSRDGGRYIPHPASWLNARGWEDEPRPNAEVRFTRQGEQNFQAARNWVTEEVS